eukprot:scaffold42039_cov33-Tisochrysis_lutea.AAC.1
MVSIGCRSAVERPDATKAQTPSPSTECSESITTVPAARIFNVRTGVLRQICASSSASMHQSPVGEGRE